MREAGEAIRAPLHAEHASVEKRAVVYEEVAFGKRSAAIEVLSIVAYEQHVTRADISHI